MDSKSPTIIEGIPLQTEQSKLRLGLMVTGLITVIIGLLFWVWVWVRPFDLIYISNLTSNGFVDELNFLRGVPLLQTLAILFGVLTLVLAKFEKASALLFGIFSAGLILTFVTGLLLDFPVRGFPLQWNWSLIIFPICNTLCLGEPFYLMIYAFFLDWTFWSVVSLGLLFAMKGFLVNALRPKLTESG